MEYNKRLFISEYEINSPPPSYTVYTLRHFTAEGTRITFLCGTDMFLTLDKWRSPEEIFKLCRVALMPREAEISSELENRLSTQAEYYKAVFNADIIRITAPAVEVSSSEIRNGDSEFKKKYLPKAVYEYITEHKLYEHN